MSHASRWEYFKAIYARYRGADRTSRQAMLDEFSTVSGSFELQGPRLFIGEQHRKLLVIDLWNIKMKRHKGGLNRSPRYPSTGSVVCHLGKQRGRGRLR